LQLPGELACNDPTSFSGTHFQRSRAVRHGVNFFSFEREVEVSKLKLLILLFFPLLISDRNFMTLSDI